MPTLQDVARRAGVSTATVSKVLSNTPYFTDETRDKVLLAVRELGYTPNLAARALSSGKTHIIAAVFPYVYDAIFQDPLVMHILEGVEAETSARGYNMLLSTPRLTAAGPDDNYLQLIASGYIDGVIAIDNVPVTSVAAPVVERAIPVVAIGYYDVPYCVRSDDYQGAWQLMRHVLDLGHRSIGIISMPDHLNFAVDERLRGLRDASAGTLDFDALPTTHGDFSYDGGRRAAQTLLTHYENLTALVCLNDRSAIGAIQWLREHGKHVPHEMTVVGYDNITLAANFTPPLTTIDQQARLQGQIAARMLFDLLEGIEPTSVLLPAQLVVRESSAPPQLKVSQQPSAAC